ncbi:MAG TPA: Crp/Fnr family transcriptional regulator [Noviherbaspirillum sp.]|nr:Crp/Fnr family transcriptional regulator [Noviherbaspirillum sp.]
MPVTLAQAHQCQNHLLARLSDEQYQRLLPVLDLVQTKAKDVLCRQGEPIQYVYFPCNCAQSCMVYMEDGSMVEVSTVGNESHTNVELLVGATHATETIVCQIAGHCLRMTVGDFKEAISSLSSLRQLAECCAQGYLAQVSQSVACNRLHSVEMRFARWLLITHDRVQGNEFNLTQEFLAAMLGVHRPSISLVAGMFQQAGFIKYSRGHMQILDREKLEEAACECYAAVRKQYQRLFRLPRG